MVKSLKITGIALLVISCRSQPTEQIRRSPRATLRSITANSDTIMLGTVVRTLDARGPACDVDFQVAARIKTDHSPWSSKDEPLGFHLPFRCDSLGGDHGIIFANRQEGGYGLAGPPTIAWWPLPEIDVDVLKKSRRFSDVESRIVFLLLASRSRDAKAHFAQESGPLVSTLESAFGVFVVNRVLKALYLEGGPALQGQICLIASQYWSCVECARGAAARVGADAARSFPNVSVNAHKRRTELELERLRGPIPTGADKEAYREYLRILACFSDPRVRKRARSELARWDPGTLQMPVCVPCEKP